ncbi:glycoside hydrolase family 5 protein [Patellaria atrata CBS 101060]|uniref:glucan 1,3-beta-glucosidase n=1 Tax=Patellaria atrata CBS 101060 TaxID=1346257 RepID=A0A9P4VTM4_9PEZI|nr:glycoside hydrolase family 5 protein [Patellaria atrata CBS 101060]
MLHDLGSAAVAVLTIFSSWSEAAPTSSIRMVKKASSFDYNTEKVQGVNLGGWLLLEPWITPSMFEGNAAVDEYTLTEILGGSAQSTMQDHWDSWITEADFGEIASAGLNHVRIPIGYWSVVPIDGEPFVQGAYKKLGEALDWATGAGLNVMIDLHGAPQSQNGFDNSGKKGSVGWTQGDTVTHTLRVLKKIRDDYASHPAVASIQLLNEPMGPQLDMNVVRQFYMDGWSDIQDSGANVIFHDAFQDLESWNSWGGGMTNLVLDTHHYEVFDLNQLRMSPSEHISSACAYGGRMASSNKATISGEWCGALTDCAKWLNGKDTGARYDGTFDNGQGTQYIGSCDRKTTGTVGGLTAEEKENIGRYIEAQLDAYESAQGWIWWTWKTEGAPEWDMRALMAAGVFPQPLNSRKYPNQCG